jgi:hypothetical protein
MRISIVAIIVMIAVAASAASAQETRRWVPIDRITMGVTGDLTLRGETLTFGNGASIHVKLLASHQRGRWSATNEPEEADIYKVDPPVNPTVLRDNTLCDKPATYIVLSYPVPHDANLSVYTGPEPPTGDGSEPACGGFSYTEG